MVEDLKEKTQEEIQARDDKQKPVELETPLEEVKRIAEETKKTAESMKETMQKLEEINANIAISGRGEAGAAPVRKKTQEDIDQEKAEEIANAFI